MTAFFISLGLLGGGAAASAALVPRPRAALLIALSALAAAAVVLLAGTVPILAAPGSAGPATFNWPLPLGTFRLAVDGLSAWFLATLAVLVLAVALYSWPYMQAETGRGSLPAYGSFLCLLVCSLVLLLMAADLVVFLAAWEAMTLSAFFLVAFHHRRQEVRRAAWMYLVVTHLGTALFVIPMFSLLASRAQGTSFAAFRAACEHCGPRAGTLLFVLGLLGFGTKAGFMPMHIWLPAAHPAAPTPVSALLSGVVIKSGIYGLFRLLSWLPSLPAGCGIAMLVVAVASGVLGVLYAIAQHDLKRLLAYHSVENIGIIGLGIGMGMLGQTAAQPVLAVLGYSGALVHVLNHALFKGLLFLSAGTVLHATGTGEIDRLGGLARSMPVNAAMFLVAAVSICGLPPFNGFVSEWILYGSLFGGAIGPVPAAAGPAALGAVALALMGGLALACFAKVFSVVFLGVPRDASIRPHPTAYLMRMGMLLLALPCIVIGLVPAMFVPLTTGGVSVVAGLSTASCHGPLHDILGSLGMLSRMAAILLGLLTGLALLRRTVLRRNRLEDGTAGPTWGCGYARPSPRMQYTASSFAWSLVDAFRYLLWPSREAPATVGCFPPPARLESHTVDVAEHDLFGPLLRGTALLFASVRTVSWPWPSGRPTALPAPGDRVGPLRALLTRLVRVLRRGGIHVCLAFMALTLLIVFVLGSLAGPGSSSSSRPSTTGTSSEVLK